MAIGTLKLNNTGVFFVGLMFAYPTTILIGLPYHLILRYQFKRHSYWLYAMGGFVIGSGVLLTMDGGLTIAAGFGGCPGIVIALTARWIVGPITQHTSKN